MSELGLIISVVEFTLVLAHDIRGILVVTNAGTRVAHIRAICPQLNIL